MASPDSAVIAQEIYLQKQLHPDAPLSEVMVRLPYTTLTNILALNYGNASGMFSSDQASDTIEITGNYQVSPDLINPQISELIEQMVVLANVYNGREEHVSVGQFCVWAGINPVLFDVIREYVKLFYASKLTFYTLKNPYSDSKYEEEFIATPDTAEAQWGAKQFKQADEEKKDAVNG